MNFIDAINLLDKKKEIPARKKSGDSIQISRSWDEAENVAVWTKEYLSTGVHKLDAFNRAEFEWLITLADLQIVNTYRAKNISREGTQLTSITNSVIPAKYIIQTKDAGISLDYLLQMEVNDGNSIWTHFLLNPQNFLKLIERTLFALLALHEKSLYHLDIKPGNIALPFELIQKSTDNYQLDLKWDDLTLIDFGYSINTKRLPSTTLPLSYEGDCISISPVLQSILKNIETESQQYLTPGKSWQECFLDANWWQQIQGRNPLENFKNLDWREDLYQLGAMLRCIRDGSKVAPIYNETRVLMNRLYDVGVHDSDLKEVDQLIRTLPEELMSYALSNKQPSNGLPHQEYLTKINEVLQKAKRANCPFQNTIHLNFDDSESPSELTPNNSHVEYVPDISDTPIISSAVLINEPVNKSLQTPLLSSKIPEPTKVMRTPPDWFQSPVHLSLPQMVAINMATANGEQLTIAKTPITCQQWLEACKYNPNLKVPNYLSNTSQLSDLILNSAISQITYQDCIQYVETVNYLTNTYLENALMHYRLISPSEWAVAASDAKLPSHENAARLPVNQWQVNSLGLLGMRGYLYHWLDDCQNSWVQVRGGARQARAGYPIVNDEIDRYPIDWKSELITLRLAKYTKQN